MKASSLCKYIGWVLCACLGYNFNDSHLGPLYAISAAIAFLIYIDLLLDGK